MDLELEEEIFLEDDLDMMEILDFGFPRQIYERSNYFQSMDDFTFFKRFRLLKGTVLHIVELIEDQLEYPHDLNNSISPINQLLTTLRFYASSGHLAAVADFMGMHESTTSRIVERVSIIIAGLYRTYVKMPSPEESLRIQANFFDRAGFPRVIGVVDGTHIKLQSPGGDDAEVYRNRKGYFSINAQVISDASLKFLDVIGRWPGSAHDNTIFNNCRIRRKFEQGSFPNCALLGDSGYALRNYILTPLANPINRAQTLYNEALIRTRNTVERAIGVWKRRFPVLSYGLRVKIQTVLAIIPATAVLHNIARDMHEPDLPLPFDIDEAEFNYLINMGEMPELPEQGEEHRAYQDYLINGYFTNL